ncbi:acyl-CoA dehydrogenase family protein [Nocardioides zeicaulis]|uniref:Acyl-CoA dehydrogenase family protein n=1 Tax=Nocardioides zeicaulis TaxID=1776857 RepID=A0ABV6E2F4_9ACTN
MDLSLTPEQASFRSEVRAWLQEHVPTERLAPPGTPEGLEQHRAWERTLFEAGFAAVHWPSESGGRGLGPIETSLFYDEYLAAGAPERLNRLALGLAGPTLIECGTPEQRERWLSRMLSCDDLWCQGFSEPGAGSDLAALRTRGVVDGDRLRVSGQKIWTSHSRFADWIFALVRTDPDAPRHRGISFVMIDRHSPGVDVRPIKQMNHASSFAEVWFDDVDVPLANVVGDLHDGWRVAMVALTNERSSNLNTAAHFEQLLREVVDMVPDDRRQDPRVLERIGRAHEEIEAYRYVTLRTLTELSQGRRPGVQSAMGKLWWSQMQTRLHELGLELMGEDAELLDPAQATNGFVHRYWLGRAAHIYAGSDEIQRNILAERWLGLPKGR